ncbi:MAG: dihydroxyacetone kinase subunit L [Clostridiales bacterium]|nr:dihydroxyacetone kinase subunit L [Clostridiales bacterium]
MKEFLTEDKVREMIVYIADKIIENKAQLSDIDSQIGDGDHGFGMAGGMRRAKEKVLVLENCGNAYKLFEAAGKAMLMSMGGASGVIFGSLYFSGGKEMAPSDRIDAAGLANMFNISLLAIKERGKAQVGDKTMVDALEPAVVAMEENREKGLLTMLLAAEEAARQGMEATKGMTAKFGRAKNLFERAVGHQDAGAVSVYIIFRSMREFVENAR